MIKEHDLVVLGTAVPSEGLVAGDVGTVVHIYHDGQAYEVEFTTLEGKTAAVITVEAFHKSVRLGTVKSPMHAS